MKLKEILCWKFINKELELGDNEVNNLILNPR